VLVPQFAHRLLPVDLDVARRWGERTAAARAAGTPVGAVDALLAATAAHHVRIPPHGSLAHRWRPAERRWATAVGAPILNPTTSETG